jgi:hypothetical protein
MGESSRRQFLTTAICLIFLLWAVVSFTTPRSGLNFSRPMAVGRSIVLALVGRSAAAAGDQLVSTEGMVQLVTLDTPYPKRNHIIQQLVDKIIKQGLPSDICPVVSTALSESANACSALQQQANDAAGCVRLEARQSLEVLLCLRPGNAEGTLLVYSLTPTIGGEPSKNRTLAADGNIYRIRISGPEILFFLGVFVTREHVRHNKSGITHRGKTRISH